MGSDGGGIAYWIQAQAEVYGAAVNQPPTMETVNAPVDPVAVNTAVSVSAPFADSNPSDSHSAVWDLGDGSTSSGNVTEAASARLALAIPTAPLESTPSRSL